LAYALKRIFDYVFAFFVLILFAPVMGLIALLIAIESRGPILFHAERVGKDGRRFRLFKFRTMVADSERVRAALDALKIQGGVAAFKLKNDPRVTRVGRFLRRNSLDELPQLLNVLRGEMSIIGPRAPFPWRVTGTENWDGFLPGVTGLEQLQMRFFATGVDPQAYDRAYARHWSLWLDAKILLATVYVLVTGRPVELIKLRPSAATPPKTALRAEKVVSRRDEEWVQVLATERTG
jgi:lipopolysaccharide/colanic/teichoic acid biosynthesis glycosyltransferase